MRDSPTSYVLVEVIDMNTTSTFVLTTLHSLTHVCVVTLMCTLLDINTCMCSYLNVYITGYLNFCVVLISYIRPIYTN